MANEFKQDVSKDQIAPTFLLLLLHAVTNVHLMHWMSKSFAEHVTLGELYEALQEGADAYAESFMGKYGQLEEFPHFYDLPEGDCVVEVEKIYNDVKILREKLPQDSDMNQLVDDIVNSLTEALYKLRFLK